MKKVIVLFALSSLFLTGCPKHEIIPAPTPLVELNASFTGVVNGAQIELTQNVDGYYLNASKIKTILPSPSLSTAVYSANMLSSQNNIYVKVSLGSINFDASASQDPALSVFNTFFTSTTNPVYSAGGNSGFEVVYRDGSGAVWTSDETQGGQNAVFTGIVQESDATGDYSKFTCTFNCNVYRTIYDSMGNPTVLSLPIQNGILKAWFKR